jgi:O-antigen biosynthesis protein
MTVARQPSVATPPRSEAALARAVVVLGAHRSGTSMITRALSLLGVELGPGSAMMAAKSDNPLGFWEHEELGQINDEVLAHLGGTWDEPPGFPNGWQEDESLGPLYRRARGIIERDFGGADRWAFKDPRSSLVVPFWQRLLPEAVYLVCLRHPLEAAGSLQRRNGFSMRKATHLWTLYTAAALDATAGTPRLLSRYERYFEDPLGELARLRDWLDLEPRPERSLAAAAEAWVRDRLRHHRAGERGVVDLLRHDGVDPWCLTLFTLLEREPAADTVELQSLCSRLRDEARLRGDLGGAGVDADRRETRQRLAASEAALRDTSRYAEDLECQLRDRDAEIAKASAHIVKVESELGATRVAFERLEAHVEAQAAAAATQARWRRQAELFEPSWARGLQHELGRALAENTAMRRSAGWRLLDRYRGWRDRVLPSGGRFERLYRRTLEGVLGRPAPSVAAGDSQAAAAVEPDAKDLAGAASRFEEREERAGSGVLPAAVAELARPLGAAPRNESTFVVDPPAGWADDPSLPPVVIAIPHWNRRDLLEQCLDSIGRYTRYPHFRACVFDQGSTDGSRELLLGRRGEIDAIFSPVNVGFVEASNAIVARYPRWDVVFLNNDTRVTEGWLDTLVRTAYAAPNIGLVGVRLVYPDGRLQEAGSEVYQDGSVRALGRTENPESAAFHQRREVDFCSAACLLVKREVLERVGAFEACFSPGYYEDVDLSFKARAAGWKTLYEPNATVYHHEYGTAATDATRLMEEHRPRFVARWRAELATRPRSQWRPAMSRASARAQSALLYIGDIVPAPDRSAGGGRLYHLLRLLARDFDVAYAYLQEYCVDEYLRPLERHGVSVFHPAMARAVGGRDVDIAAVLREVHYDTVVCSLYQLAERTVDLVRQCSPHSRFVVDTYDLHWLRELRASALRGDREAERRALATRERELAVYRQADAVLTVTEEERRVLEGELGPQARVGVVPTVHYADVEPPGRDGREGLLFVGGFSHEPNVDAALFLVERVLPLVRAELPETTLRLVGNSPSPEIVALDAPGVEVVGYAPHLQPFLERALVSVAPMRFGSGMKGKVAEAMACGLPVVTTPIGAEGMDLRDGETAMIGDSAEELASRIVRLCRDHELWTRMAAAARAEASRKWSPEAVGRAAVEFLRSLPPRSGS